MKQVVGCDPRIVATEEAAEWRDGHDAARSTGLCQEDPGLADVALDCETVGSLDESPGDCVVPGQSDLGAARQRAPLGTNLAAAEVHQHRSAFGGGIKLQHGGRSEPIRDLLPQSRRHPGADEHADWMVALGRVGRCLDQITNQRPGVGHDGDAIATDLVPERGRIEAGGQGQSGASGHRPADAGQQAAGVVDRRDAVHRVARGQRCGGGGAERRQGPAPVGDVVDADLVAPAREQDERQVFCSTRVGQVPGRNPHSVGVDALHVGHPWAEVPLVAASTQHIDGHRGGVDGQRAVLGVGHDPVHLTEPHLAGDVGAGSEHHGDGSQPTEGRHRSEAGWAGVHQHTNVFALAHPNRDQALHHVVDANLGVRVAVAAALEQKEGVVGVAGGLLIEQRPQADAGVVAHLLQAGQPRQLGHGLTGQALHGLAGVDEGANHRAGHVQAHAGRQVQVERGPLGGADDVRLGLCHVANPSYVDRLFANAIAPEGPRRHRRPGDGGSRVAHHQAKVSGSHRRLIDVGARSGLVHGPHSRGWSDFVDLADERQHRYRDIGQRDRATLDHEAALQHAIVGDELTHEVGQRRGGPGDPPVAHEKSPLPLPGEQRIPVVQLGDEVDSGPQRLQRVHQFEAETRGPRWQTPELQVVGHQPEHPAGHVLGDTKGNHAAGVGRAAKGHHRGQPDAAPIGGGLVAEHASLAVATEVHVTTRLLPYPVDRIADRQHVIGERALQSAFFVLGCTEVDHPRVDSGSGQVGHGADGGCHVVHVGRQHHGWYQHHRRPGQALPFGGGHQVGEVPTQAIGAVLVGHLER